ncbi:prefoldin subunit alpha [Candidatus Aciduliprofundum boonei]|uniref:Prefoldin subunit alpha n=1 Tax=Aciduliprofundum boonei (strain DSM 19572 / T469) TaxID=439481 RepID=B5ICI9_ACIB4|nr:prefoldin subunit alpha [Candidatus Aciduliprofundum boonei]ADD09066.1 prefoldin, alpha subunit [Aciduliprofundum boonei T469]EDY36056.1 prefoldin, alpha subunit [Aciduliprofundum boonei T469]HII55276.1 prefoldin subunit alpha [Candidatus Aciduliprofundum boonei]
MNEEELEKGLATLEVLKAQISNLQTQIDALQRSIQEHTNAKETIEGYMKMENDEILVPIGAGVMISAKVQEKKGLITIGNELYTELPLEKILEKIEKRKKDLEDLQLKLSTDLKRLQENYAVLSAKVEQDYAKYIEERKNVQGP